MVCALAAAGAVAGPPRSAMTFSIDGQSRSIFELSPFYGLTILESDVLTPAFGTQPPYGAPGPNPPMYPPALRPTPGEFITNPPQAAIGDPVLTPGLRLSQTTDYYLELDALSFGRDHPVAPVFPDGPQYSVFSVDEFAIGLPGTAVRSEGAKGAQEAAADTFLSQVGPVPSGNRAFTDGDGISPSGAPGVGLIEPNPPTLNTGAWFDPGNPADPLEGTDLGDNLDAVDFGTTLADQYGPVYFSLDSNNSPQQPPVPPAPPFTDPLEGGPSGQPNHGSAAANGFVGGDVLVGRPNDNYLGGPVALYASADLLGLDLLGSDTDDLDALALWENGIAGYQPSTSPFDWVAGTTDMLLFSVRRNSAVIGMIDSILGLAIEEGDILTTPCVNAGTQFPGGGTCVGGNTPGIFTAAESLGLATVRSGTGASWGVPNPQWSGRDIWADDLDALDTVPTPTTLALFGLGLAGLTAARRRRSN